MRVRDEVNKEKIIMFFFVKHIYTVQRVSTEYRLWRGVKE